MNQGLKLLVGAGGIYGSFLTYGKLHEQIFKYAAEDGARFTYAFFLQVCIYRGICLCLSLTLTRTLTLTLTLTLIPFFPQVMESLVTIIVASVGLFMAGRQQGLPLQGECSVSVSIYNIRVPLSGTPTHSPPSPSPQASCGQACRRC
jgi:hypothetical protein